MKTVYAPDSLPDLAAAIRAAAESQPVLVLAVLVIVCAAFATWASK